MKKIIATILAFACMGVLAMANPVSAISRSKAKANLKASLEEDYGSSYSTIQMLYKANKNAHDRLNRQ